MARPASRSPTHRGRASDQPYREARANSCHRPPRRRTLLQAHRTDYAGRRAALSALLRELPRVILDRGVLAIRLRALDPGGEQALAHLVDPLAVRVEIANQVFVQPPVVLGRERPSHREDRQPVYEEI